MARRKKKLESTAADYMTMALSPILIMGLVGSLVFFLLEIGYAGDFAGRLQWTLFFFVFACVLIARISIEQGMAKAGFYALGLGIVVFLAMSSYIVYTPLSAALVVAMMCLAWWSAHRLTWDCTHIDDAVDASGLGVLEAAGLEGEKPVEPAPANLKAKPGLFAWWDRYVKYREEQNRKPHTPGVWVVYFSLAALPLYGLGQSLIPPTEASRRVYAFWLMVCYVGCGLGLLLTTSFLGLRRYLRQRNLKMPASMTGLWLMLGGGMIVAFMLLGALLPRPWGEYQLISLSPLQSKERSASRYAMKRDGKGKGEGSASREPTRDEKNAKSGSGQQKSQDSKTTRSSEKGQPGKSQSKSGQKGDGQKSGKQGSEGKSSQSKNDQQTQESKQKQQDSREGQAQDDKDKTDEERKREGEEKEDEASSGASGSSTSSNPVAAVAEKLGWLGTLLKWIVFGILALVVLFFLFRSGLRFLATFTAWAGSLLKAIEAWWAGLFGGKPEEEEEAEAARVEAARRKRPRPFAFFSNPFDDGTAGGQSPDEVVRYTFTALESWGYEMGMERESGETPLEYASRLEKAHAELRPGASKVASLYARSLYGRGRLTEACLPMVEPLWVALEQVEKRPAEAVE